MLSRVVVVLLCVGVAVVWVGVVCVVVLLCCCGVAVRVLCCCSVRCCGRVVVCVGLVLL